MKRIVLGILLVALVLCICPASAYTMEINMTKGVSGTMNQYFNYIGFAPVMLYNATWLHAEMACNAPSVSSGTEEVSFWSGGTNYANATRVWSYKPGMTYLNKSPYGLTMDYYITSASPSPSTTLK